VLNRVCVYCSNRDGCSPLVMDLMNSTIQQRMMKGAVAVIEKKLFNQNKESDVSGSMASTMGNLEKILHIVSILAMDIQLEEILVPR
jgi:hypothetical protein